MKIAPVQVWGYKLVDLVCVVYWCAHTHENKTGSNHDARTIDTTHTKTNDDGYCPYGPNDDEGRIQRRSGNSCILFDQEHTRMSEERFSWLLS
jgi:hypothetical protein